MFDPAEEQPIRLNDVPTINWLPTRRAGAKLNIATVHRWASRGVGGVKLETLPIGGTRCTSEAALKRFFAKIGNPNPPTERPEQKRKSAIARANARLAAAGI